MERRVLLLVIIAVVLAIAAFALNTGDESGDVATGRVSAVESVEDSSGGDINIGVIPPTVEDKGAGGSG